LVNHSPDNLPYPLSGHIIARNVFINISGLCLPFIAAFVCTPVLINGLGVERFGILTIVWASSGYFSIFEMGIARAQTKFLSERSLIRGDTAAPQFVWTTFISLSILGIAGGVITALLSPWVVTDLLKIPADLHEEAKQAFCLLSFSVPFITASIGFKGVLEAYQRFDLSNLVKVPLNIMVFLGPVCVLPVTKSLPAIVGVLLAIWAVALLGYLFLCYRIIPEFRFKSAGFDLDIYKKLAGFGVWITISSIVNPLMANMDRFLIGMSISMAAVSFYSAPYEIVTKLLHIPGALMSVMFPAFALMIAKDRLKTEYAFNKSIDFICVVIIPIVLLCSAFAGEGLRFWLNIDFAIQSSRVLQVMAIGVLFNAIAQVPLGLIHGSGRPDLTAKLHLAELPVYLIGLWVLIDHFGIVGAAVAWMIRAVVDMVGMFEIARKLSLIKSIYSQKRNGILIAAIASVIAATLIHGIVLKSVFVALSISAYLFAMRYHIQYSFAEYRSEK
jgi:O-antigen/teichoic acid export membrane protein